MEENSNVEVNGAKVILFADVYERINEYRKNSRDASFHRYLDSVESCAKNASRPASELYAELEVNYNKYLSVFEKSHGTENLPDTPAKADKPDSIEFKLGVGVLSVVGVLFLLIALISFGRYFLKDAALGIAFMAISACVILISELFVEKRNSKIAHLTTGFGIAAMYFSVIFSSVSLKLYPEWVAIVLVLAVSVGSYILSRIRKSGTIEMIIGLGVASIALPYMDITSLPEFALYASTIIIVNLLLFLLPFDSEKEAGTSSVIVRMFALLLAALALTTRFCDEWKAMYAIFDVFVLALYALVNARAGKKNISIKVTSFALFCIDAFLIICRRYTVSWSAVIAISGVLLVCLLAAIFNEEKEDRYSFAIVFISYITLQVIAFREDIVFLLVVITCLLIIKILEFYKSSCISVFDCVYSTFAFVAALGYHEEPLVYAIFAVAIIGCFVSEKNRMYHVISTASAILIFSFLCDEFWVSIALMIAAFVLIAGGAVINKAELRLSGLIIALVVCIKVAFYDARELGELMRMVVFFAVGLIAIAISFIYLAIEKKEKRQLSKEMTNSDSDVVYGNIGASLDASDATDDFASFDEDEEDIEQNEETDSTVSDEESDDVDEDDEEDDLYNDSEDWNA